MLVGVASRAHQSHPDLVHQRHIAFDNSQLLVLSLDVYLLFLFFFQAEDGIRDVAVTGVQTCALPISGILLILAVLLGVALAPKVRLSSPIAEAAASGRQLRRPLLPQIIPGLLGGMMGGVAIVLTAQLWKPLLAPEVIARIAGFGKLLPVPTRLLYGGITEELLMRWALMTVLVWAIWRLFQKGRGRPNSSCYVSAILISSVVFGVGHLPVAFLVVPNVTLSLAGYVIVVNSAFGFVAGYLYWRKGLESAMIAHMSTHLVILTASYHGAYF